MTERVTFRVADADRAVDVFVRNGVPVERLEIVITRGGAVIRVNSDVELTDEGDADEPEISLVEQRRKRLGKD